MVYVCIFFGSSHSVRARARECVCRSCALVCPPLIDRSMSQALRTRGNTGEDWHIYMYISVCILYRGFVVDVCASRACSIFRFLCFDALLWPSSPPPLLPLRAGLTSKGERRRRRRRRPRQRRAAGRRPKPSTMKDYTVCRDRAEQSLTLLKAVASKNLEETLGRECSSSLSSSTRSAGVEYCRSATAAEMRKGLSALKNVLTLFGSPQKAVPVVHVVGSKGKGSVSHLIAGTLLQIGLRVGTFRSPHVICPTERLQFGRCPIDIGDTPVYPGNRKTILQALRSLSMMYELSAFEAEVAAAFLAFRSMKCDVAVVEAGKWESWQDNNTRAWR